jgi:NAD(P)H-nitrite reductase large subunit
LIVCHCTAASDHDVADAIERGASSVDAVGARCGAGTGCGGCRPTIHELLERRGHRCSGTCGDCPRAGLGCAA